MKEFLTGFCRHLFYVVMACIFFLTTGRPTLVLIALLYLVLVYPCVFMTFRRIEKVDIKKKDELAEIN